MELEYPAIDQKRAKKNIYHGIRGRCYKPLNPQYKNYGARGIKMCDRWLNSFELFSQDIGERPSMQHSLDRINSDGDYELGNVRWATWTTQARNKRSNVYLTYKGKTMIITD